MNLFSKARGGYLYVLLAATLTLFATAFGHTRIHYPVFTQATRLVWAEQPAYGFALEPGTGYATYWLYSPSCALTFFSLFAFVPDPVGRFAYLAFSLAVFLTGLRAASGLFGLRRPLEELSLFWVALSFELVGSTSAFKIELITAGLALWASTLLSRRREFAAAALLAVIVNWKFQGIPVAGLLLATHVARTRSLRTPFVFGLLLAAYFALPYLVLSRGYLADAHREWARSLAESMEATWTGYQHVWASLRAVGVELSLRTAQTVAAVVGVALALLCVREGRRSVRRPFVAVDLSASAPESPHLSHECLEPYALAVSLGLAYAVLFSPMSQSLGYVFWAPLLLESFVRREAAARRERAVWNALLFAAVFCVSIASSDLVPRAVSAWSREVTLKPYGVMLLFGAVLFRQLCRPKPAACAVDKPLPAFR